MNNQESIDKMKQMNLYGMARAMTSALDMGLTQLSLF